MLKQFLSFNVSLLAMLSIKQNLLGLAMYNNLKSLKMERCLSSIMGLKGTQFYQSGAKDYKYPIWIHGKFE